MSATIPLAFEEKGVAFLVNKLASLLRSSPALSKGDLASLRRMDPRRPSTAFFKLEGLMLDDLFGETAPSPDTEARWAAIALGLAHLGPLHHPGIPLGAALAGVRLSEPRLIRLLEADSEQLLDEVPVVARLLVARDAAADWSSAARLILSSGRADEEPARRALARDYYRAVARQDAR